MDIHTYSNIFLLVAKVHDIGPSLHGTHSTFTNAYRNINRQQFMNSESEREKPRVAGCKSLPAENQFLKET